jgi:hypothetical protein
MALISVAREHGNGAKDLTGLRFNLLMVLSRAGTSTSGRAMWLCQCDCGKTVTVVGKNLLNGNTGGCGCTKGGRIHGQYKSHEHQVWRDMLGRCYNPRAMRYPRYGARGITVCERWHEFVAFSADMGPRPEGMTLDRIDNDGNYEPSNCRWATRKQQQRNNSRNVILTLNGTSKTVIEWAESTGIKECTIHTRLSKGWTHEKVLTLPVKRTGRPPRKVA